MRAIAAAAVFAAVVMAAHADAQQTVQRSRFLEAERAVYLARMSAQRGDLAGTVQHYSTAVSLAATSAPVGLNLSKLFIAEEPLPSIGRRLVYYEIMLLQETLAQPDPSMPPDTASPGRDWRAETRHAAYIRPQAVLENLRRDYGKMAWIEPSNPTWPYLEAVALAADRNYRAAFQKCREAAQRPGGEESVRRKARSLAKHIKPAALAQERMKEEDQRAYQEYVESGAQALDFAIVSAQVSANQARMSGDIARADMWERRYQDLSRQREQIGR